MKQKAKSGFKKFLFLVTCLAVICSSAFTIADGVEKRQDNNTEIVTPVNAEINN